MARWPVYADSELAGLCRLCRGRYMPTLPAVAGRLRCPEYADSQVAGICRPLTVAKLLHRGRVGRALEEGRQLANSADVAFLRSRLQLAHAHVVDHALAQRRTSASR